MKKLNKVEQVKALLVNEPRLTVDDVVKALGVKKPYATTLLWKAKGGAKKKRVAKVVRAEKPNTVRQYSNAEVDRVINAFSSHVKTLTEQVENLTNQNTALKIDMLDQQAVINYLEKKLIK
jgi:hypothetical protein